MSDYFPYDQDNGLHQLCGSISTCRAAQCPVVKRHPFYPAPVQPPLYHGQRPCLPVVPTYLARGKVMIVGEYPNCRYATISDPETGQRQELVPIADINEPFEGGRYFNGWQVQLYPTGQSLQENYFRPLGLDRETDVWLTNAVKCFLLKKEQVELYRRLGWVQPGSKTGASYDAYFKAAAICGPAHLARELAICQPRLVIGLGERVYRLMHGSADWKTPAPDPPSFGPITGAPLRAGVVSQPWDTRNALFKNLNVIHLFHPSALIREAPIREKHLAQDIPPTRAFMQELGL